MISLVVTVLALAIGIGLSRLLTRGVVCLFKDKMAVEETIRTTAVSQLDTLLEKCSSTGLDEQEKQLLQSSLMAYMMKAKSVRSAKQYLERAKTAKVDAALLAETEMVIQERFPTG